jgi:hypothetical protein
LAKPFHHFLTHDNEFSAANFAFDVDKAIPGPSSAQITSENRSRRNSLEWLAVIYANHHKS